MAIATIVVARHLHKEHRAGKDTGRLINQLYEPAIDDGTSFALSPDSRLSTRFAVREVEMLTPDSHFSQDRPKAAPSFMSTSGFSARMFSLLHTPPSPNNSPAIGHPKLPSTTGQSQFWAKPEPVKADSPTELLQSSPVFRTVRIAKLPMTASFGQDPEVEEAR